MAVIDVRRGPPVKLLVVTANNGVGLCCVIDRSMD